MTQLKYRTENNTLFLASLSGEEIPVALPFPVAKVLPFPDILVVCVQPDVGCIFNENVFGIDAEGHIKWQISKRTYAYQDSPFTGIARAGSTAILYNWDGTDLEVDPATGNVLSESFSK